MVTLDKVFEDLFAISKGDVATLTRATKEFVHDVTQENLIPASAPTVGPVAPQPTSPLADAVNWTIAGVVQDR